MRQGQDEWRREEVKADETERDKKIQEEVRPDETRQDEWRERRWLSGSLRVPHLPGAGRHRVRIPTRIGEHLFRRIDSAMKIKKGGNSNESSMNSDLIALIYVNQFSHRGSLVTREGEAVRG